MKWWLLALPGGCLLLLGWWLVTRVAWSPREPTLIEEKRAAWDLEGRGFDRGTR